jgi:oligopeptide/dipeptide ABC transporter ATP-binding protein
MSSGGERELIVTVRNVSKQYQLRHGFKDRVFRRDAARLNAVNDVSFDITAGETLGVVGESGCGKSTLGRMLVGLERPTSGEIWFQGNDICCSSERELRQFRRSLQFIFQDPFSTLNPRMRIGSILREVLLVNKLADRGSVGEAVAELLETVELPRSLARRYPSHLSGGQRQRVGIARALAVEPSLIVADEPISALDASIQAQILNLIVGLSKTRGMTWIFIGHNLASVRQVADRVAVMYLGRIVEIGSSSGVFSTPLHPYTQLLIDSVPSVDPGIRMPDALALGEPPSPVNLPPGCAFASRCRLARGLCVEEIPPLIAHEGDQMVACWAASSPARWDASGDPNDVVRSGVRSDS